MSKRLTENEEAVLAAVRAASELLSRPVNGREVARQLKWDSASVTNRLSELTKKGKLKIAYRKKGLDGLWRNYYVTRVGE
jgi:Mn-dependent DtxR family transcriptional regulator